MRNQLARVYDRLRKRSYRSAWTEREHEAYVAGVRDALNAVKTLQENA